MADTQTDFVIITALPEERDAILAKLRGYNQLPPTEHDVRVYYSAEVSVAFFDGSACIYKVIVLCLLGMGRVEAANATGDAIRRWNPRYVLMVGIAGGVAQQGVNLGDILISEQVVDYELQKLTPNERKVRYSVHRSDPRLINAAMSLGEDWRKLLRRKRPEKGRPRKHIGPIATGDKVIAVDDVLNELRQDWPKLIGVEMEAGGVASAAFQSACQPGFFMIRGVSDLADGEKDTPQVTNWRLYACDVASSFAIGLLQNGPVPRVTEGNDSHHDQELAYLEKLTRALAVREPANKIVTWTDLILVVGKFLFGSGPSKAQLQFRRIERVATYLDQIAHALQRAAKAFEEEASPWDIYRQVEVHFEHLFDTLGDALTPIEVQQLHYVLRQSLEQDRMLLGPTRARINLDAITISTDQGIELPYDHELRLMSDADVSLRLQKEIDKIREAAGIFTAYAIELRARQA